MRRGELDAARALADRAVDVTRDKPDSEWARRFTLLLGEVLIRKHELPEARRLLSAELPGGSSFDQLRARREFLRGWLELLDQKRQDASVILQRARELAPSSGDLRLDIDVLDGVIHLQGGRNQQGESLLLDVLRAATDQGDRYHQAIALNNLGYGQLVQKRYDAALTWLEKALALTDLSDLTIYADVLNNVGICYSRLGQFDRAAAAQRRAVDRHERGARREHEQALGQLGTTYIRWNKVREGLPYLRQALEVATSAGLTADAGIWSGNLADAHIDLGEWEEAERFNNESTRLKTAAGTKDVIYNTLRTAHIAAHRQQLDEASRLFNEGLASGQADPSVRWSAHEGLAHVAIARGQPSVAMRHFEAALETIEKTRSEVVQTDYKLSYLTRLIAFYRTYVDFLVDGKQIERALEVADSSRARVLAERQGVAALSDVRASSFRSRAAESAMVFLSYWLGPVRSYLWVVTPARVQLVTLPAAQDIEALVREHQAAIHNVVADPLKSADSPGDRLFRLLVEPALPSIPRGGSVLVVPDGALYGLNLETLPVAASGTNGSPRRYWIEDVEIQLAPSLAMLKRRAEPPSSGKRPGQMAASSLLLIGNPTPRNPEYPALKYAAAEMTSVSRHFPAGRVTSYQGEQAVPAVYQDARPDRFSHVHFTAHATANLDSPLDSAVVLTGPDAAFKLYARDVAAQPLRAELVTVSACRSAGERTYSGEGLVGFAWAFLRGGAQRVVAGLWDVDDRSTAELMDLLYGGMSAGEPVGKALRAAKLTMLHRGGATAQPYYWAPFELFTLSP